MIDREHDDLVSPRAYFASVIDLWEAALPAFQSPHRAYCTLLALLIVAMPASAADEPTSIEQFNAQSRIWKQLVGTRLVLEGRCFGWSSERLRMTGCELQFEFEEGLSVPRAKPRNVVVTGHLQDRGARLVFIVTNLRNTPGDLEQLRLRRGKIDVNSSDDWYELADWARQRAAFYEDEELDSEATELYRQGVQAEYRRMPGDDSAGLVALAERAKRFGLGDGLRMEFLHEAVSRELEAAESGGRPGFDTVLTHALDWLPGARVPLLQYDREAQARGAAYLQSRPATYAAAEDDDRRILERLLYIHVTLRKIEDTAEDDGRNGFAIAERIEASIPELDELPEEYRQREIDWQIGNVAGATREELLVLVDRLEDRERGDQAQGVKQTWLEAQAARFRRSGVSGRLELASEYLDLLEDKEAAVEIYRDLYQSAESQQIAARRLQELGYIYDGEEWRAEAPSDNENDLSTAIRNGSVREGMTQADVRSVLGAPETTLRFAARGQVVELWVYPGPGVSIRFARRRTNEEQTAIEVFNLPVRTREQLRP